MHNALNSRAVALAGSASPTMPMRDFSPVKNRASGTFTPIYDEDLALALKPTSAMLLWTVLNRFWSMRTPLYTPGQERLMKHTGLSKKTIERAMKVLQQDRACRFRCGREHPLVLVRWNGMGHNATVSPFTCDLTIKTKSLNTEDPAANTKIANTLLDQKGHNDASLYDAEASIRRSPASHNDAPLVEVMRQKGSALLGTQKPLLETSATDTTAVVAGLDENHRFEASKKLIAFGVGDEKAKELISRFGPQACLKKLNSIEERRHRGRRRIENPPGLLITALEHAWIVPDEPLGPPTVSSTSTPAPGIIQALKIRLESGKRPDTRWLKDAGISSVLYAEIEKEIDAKTEIASFTHPLSDAFEATDRTAYEAAMQRLYEGLNPPFGITAGGYRHALFFSRCRTLLERELSSNAP